MYTTFFHTDKPSVTRVQLQSYAEKAPSPTTFRGEVHTGRKDKFMPVAFVDGTSKSRESKRAVKSHVQRCTWRQRKQRRPSQLASNSLPSVGMREPPTVVNGFSRKPGSASERLKPDTKSLGQFPIKPQPVYCSQGTRFCCTADKRRNTYDDEPWQMIGEGFHDPFGGFPISLDMNANECLHHFRYFAETHSCAFGALLGLLSVAMSETSIRSAVVLGGAHLAFATPLREPRSRRLKECTVQKGLILGLVKNMLSDSCAQTSDEAVFAVSTLTAVEILVSVASFSSSTNPAFPFTFLCGEWRLTGSAYQGPAGSPSVAKLHMSGLKQMTKIRGGLEVFPRKLRAWLLLWVSLRSCNSSRID